MYKHRNTKTVKLDCYVHRQIASRKQQIKIIEIFTVFQRLYALLKYGIECILLMNRF